MKNGSLFSNESHFNLKDTLLKLKSCFNCLEKLLFFAFYQELNNLSKGNFEQEKRVYKKSKFLTLHIFIDK